jgi:3D (Asp-Asp-Asp) domain-containing protein
VPVSFTLHEDGYAFSQAAPGPAVGDALAALGVAVSEHDLVSPDPSSPLLPGMHVYVQHAMPVEVAFGSERRIVFTRAATVGEVLAEAGYALEPTDLVFPSLESAVRSGAKITVTTLRETIEYQDQPIPFDTRYEYDASLPQGASAVLQAGVEGHFRRQYRVRSVNGIEVLRELVSEVVIPPSDEVVSVGTYVEPAPQPAPTPPPAVVAGPGGELVCVRTLTVYATWYTAASAGGSGITATGVPVDKGIVAVDPSVIPLGTHMYIPGYGYAVAADTGGGIIGNMIDLGFGDDDVPDWHTRSVDICILD